jgi:hypothetical protein
MGKIVKILLADDATLIYLLSIFMIGIIHKKDEGTICGIVLGIWRFQTQLTLGYSSKLENIQDIGHA